MFSRRLIAAAGAAAILLSVAGCSSSAELDEGAGEDAEAPLDITYGWILPSPNSLPASTAMSQGYFDDNLLTVDTLAAKSGPELVASVISNSANVAISPTDGVIGALNSGQDLVMVPPFLRMNLDLVADPARIPTQDVAGLKGKVIGVTALGGITERFGRAIVAEAGLDPDKDVTFLGVGVGPAAMASFQHGQVDAMVQTPAANVRFKEAGSDVVVLASSADDTAGDIGKRGIIAVNVAKRDFVEKSPAAFERYCAAMGESISFLQDPANDAGALSEFATVNALEDSQVKDIYKGEISRWTMAFDEDEWAYNLKFAENEADLPFDRVVALCK